MPILTFFGRRLLFDLKSRSRRKTKSNRSFTGYSNNPAPQSAVSSEKPAFIIQIFVLLLIFISVFPLACADIWYEAIVFAAVFVLSGAVIFRSCLNEAAPENRRLLTPLVILAVYSLFQGLITVLIENGSLSGAPFLPLSFETSMSFWSAVKIVAFALFLLLLFINFRRRVKLLTWGLIFTGNFFAAFGIARFLLQDNYPGAFESILPAQLIPGVGFGTYFNQNHFAYLMLMVFGLHLGLLRFGNRTKAIRLLLATGGLVVWTALVLTGSRGGIIASFAEIAVLIFLPVFLRSSRRDGNQIKTVPSRLVLASKQTAILGLVFGLFIVGIALIGQDRVIGRFEDIPQQIGGVTSAGTFRRIDVWKAALTVIEEFPIFGVGFGGFRVAVSRYIDISGQIAPKQAHNDYLEFAASGGVIAVGTAVWFLLRFFSLVKKRFTEPSHSFSRAARIGAICGIVGVALHSLFDFGLQFTANLLFFAALLALAVHKSENGKTETKEVLNLSKTIVPRFVYPIPALTLACYSAFFGYASYTYEQAINASGAEFGANNFYKMPFDAAYYEARSSVFENSGDYAAAAGELKNAAALRPYDYNLWLKQANLAAAQNQNPEADNAFRRAAELAPLYGEPHFYYGIFLVNTDRKEQGFAELRFASRRTPQYFDKVIEFFWRETGGNANETVRLLSPLDNNEQKKLTDFFFDRREFAAIVQLNCRAEDLTAPHRDALVRKLLAEKLYGYARQIYKRNCGPADSNDAEIEDGDFERGDARNGGAGFGWRLNDLSNNTSVSLDKDNARGGNYSIRFDFNGKEESAALLSQIVIVKKKQRYRLHFSYKTAEIVTGGVPVVQIVEKQSGSEILLGRVKLAVNQQKWIESALDFQTNERIEAVEIRLAREPCPEAQCPIFGSLCLDNFALK